MLFRSIKAWALWWKGFAYSRVGSMYVSGIITDEVGQTNSDFKDRTVIIEEARKNFDQAIDVLNDITDMTAYNAVLDKLIISFTKIGKGGLFTPAEWNTFLNVPVAYSDERELIFCVTAEQIWMPWKKGMAI